jgi:hypothetical protein
VRVTSVPNGSAWLDSSKRTTACANQMLYGATLACSEWMRLP